MFLLLKLKSHFEKFFDGKYQKTIKYSINNYVLPQNQKKINYIKTSKIIGFFLEHKQLVTLDLRTDINKKKSGI